MIKLTRANPHNDELTQFRINEQYIGAVEERTGELPGSVIFTSWGRMYVVRESVEAVLRAMGKGVPGE